MADFMSPSADAYKSLGGPDKYATISELVTLANDHELFAAAVALNLDDFYSMPAGDQAIAENNPYGLCAAQLIGLMLTHIENFNLDEDIAYAYEVGGTGEAAFTDAMIALMRELPHVKQTLRVCRVLPIRSKSETPAMDLADVLAWVYNHVAPTWRDSSPVGTYSSLIMTIPCAHNLLDAPGLRLWADENRDIPPHVAHGRSVYGSLAAHERRGRS